MSALDRRRRGTKTAARLTLDRLEQVRVLAHPLRLRLVEIFAEGPHTTKQVADRLKLPATRLYHHVAALERVGILTLRETRPNRGTTEKYYEAVARRLELDPARLGGSNAGGSRGRATARLAGEGAAAIALQVLDRAREEFAFSLDASIRDRNLPDERRPMVARVGIHAPAHRLKAVQQEIAEFIARLERMERGEGKKVGNAPREAVRKPPAEEGPPGRAWLTILFTPETVPDPWTKKK